MTTNSQNLVTVSIDGKSRGIFDTRSGGESTAAVTKYYPGGARTPVVDAARGDVSDVTVTRRHDGQRDEDLVKEVRRLIGRGVMKVTEQPLDVDGVAYGKPTTYSGRISSVTGGDADSNSDDTRMVSITMVAVAVA